MKNISIARIALTSFLWVLAANFAFAQEAPSIAQFQEQIQKHTLELENISHQVADNLNQDETLLDARLKLDELQTNVLQIDDEIQSQSTQIDAAIEELGPKPEGEETQEQPIVAKSRADLTAQRSALGVMSNEANLLLDNVQSLIDRVATERRNNFTNSLIKRTPMNSNLLSDAASAAATEWAQLKRVVQGWWRFVISEKIPQTLFSAFAAISAALFLSYFTRLSRQQAFRNSGASVSYFERLISAFWRAVLPSLAFVACLLVSYALFQYFDLFTDKIDQLVTSLFSILAGIVFVRNLALGIFSTKEPNFRLVSTSNKSASLLVLLFTALASVNGADIFVGQINKVLSAPLSLTVAKSLIAALLIGALLIGIALVRGRTVEVNGDRQEARWPKIIYIPIFVFGIGIILAAFSGYIGFARFLSQQVIITSAIIATMYLGLGVAREIGQEGVLRNTRLGEYFAQSVHLEDERIEQLSVLASLTTTIAVLLSGIPLLFLQWGAQFQDITSWISKLFFGFQIGGYTFSLSAILVAMAVFLAIYLIAQFFKRWLDKNVLVRSRVDSGVRDSIKAGIGYTGLALASLFAITTAGIDLSSLAIVAGALSLGIGFGLQNIVNNFVSGLILLIERPIKVGDWVEVGETSGTVKKISVRATEISTFSRQSIIVPNSELINSRVGNWTHVEKSGRIEIAIGVAYGTDPRLVEKLLLGLVETRTNVLKSPKPYVVFMGFGDSSLDFELRCFLRNIEYGLSTSSEIRYDIVEAFAQHNIEIPFPQSDLNIKSVPTGFANVQKPKK